MASPEASLEVLTFEQSPVKASQGLGGKLGSQQGAGPAGQSCQRACLRTGSGGVLAKWSGGDGAELVIGVGVWTRNEEGGVCLSSGNSLLGGNNPFSGPKS